MLAKIRSVLRAVLRRDRFEDAMREEIRFHVAARVDDLAASGVPRTEAERRAHLEFGGVEAAKEECRSLLKSPAFWTIAALTLALPKP